MSPPATHASPVQLITGELWAQAGADGRYLAGAGWGLTGGVDCANPQFADRCSDQLNRDRLKTDILQHFMAPIVPVQRCEIAAPAMRALLFKTGRSSYGQGGREAAWSLLRH